MSSMTLEEDISELIQCTICIEMLTDTRVLRCGHTFCLHCLQRYGRGKAPGDSVTCPVCRTRFKVPFGGFASLPRNFLLEKILEIHSASLANTSEVWRDPIENVRRPSVTAQSTQTSSTSTVDDTIGDAPQVVHTLDEMQQVEQQQQQQQQQQTQQRQHRQQIQRQQRQQQSQLEQQRQQPIPVPQRKRKLVSRRGWSPRLMMNAFLISLVMNFLLTGNIWHMLDSMKEERANWTNRELEFEETIQKLIQENKDKQITIADHHLRCTERVESSLEDCRNDLTFYKGFLQTVTKLLDTHTTPQQPTFSVM